MKHIIYTCWWRLWGIFKKPRVTCWSELEEFVRYLWRSLERNKTITFLNLAAQSPSLELALGVSDKIQSKLNSNHIFYICDSAQKSCSVNIKNKKSICSLCIKKAGVDLYKRKNKNVEVKYISRKDLITGQKKFSNLINEEIELGVNSTIASQFRISKMEQLDSKWEFYRRKMLESSFGLYNYFSNHT